jgi:hypothetical protein
MINTVAGGGWLVVRKKSAALADYKPKYFTGNSYVATHG